MKALSWPCHKSEVLKVLDRIPCKENGVPKHSPVECSVFLYHEAQLQDGRPRSMGIHNGQFHVGSELLWCGREVERPIHGREPLFSLSSKISVSRRVGVGACTYSTAVLPSETIIPIVNTMKLFWQASIGTTDTFLEWHEGIGNARFQREHDSRTAEKNTALHKTALAGGEDK
ncbi:hypothetical protein FIBSPDRAFT_235209 [Athelia psychrophila]|uniref:Uncharacterized protein n=1 Tax=Athelia psychrophila TaxID=1759441 RepID=A0A166RZQ5_9AGAM|nr:hypothetical protein FIBSPDRAFT_235209 [Fibularhizoctonia sp. CBS 109695]